MSKRSVSRATLDAYEAFMSEQNMIFPNLKDAEHDGFPPVAEVFDADPLVSQHTLWLNYWLKHADLFDQDPTVLPGLMARVYRMYPSLVREHHLMLLLCNEGYDLVIRNRELDSNGVDYLILHGGKAYSVAAYVDTPRSRMFRKRKQARHKVFGTRIELPLNMEDAGKIGQFSVYGADHLTAVRSVIEQD